MNSKSQQSSMILHFAAVIGVALLVMLVYSSSFATMWEQWQRSSHQHGILIFPISAYLVWRIAPKLAAAQASWSWVGFAGLVAVSSIWLTGRLAGVQLVEHFAALALIPMAVLAVRGTRVFRVAMFPLLLVLLATPISDSFVPFLMSTTADISTALLRASGYPVLRSGQHLSLPGGSFVVAEVCSGVRYLMAGTTIALLFSYLSFSSGIRRLVFVVAMTFVLVLANGFRAFAVMAVGSSSNMRYMAGADHVYFGWVLFGLIMLAAMWLGSRYADEPAQAIPDARVNRSGLASISENRLVMILGVLMLLFTFNPLGSESLDTGKGIVMALAVIALLAYAIIAARSGKIRFQGSDRWTAKTVIGIATPWAIAGALLALVPLAGSNILASAPVSVEYVDLHNIHSCHPQNRWSENWMPSFRHPAIELGVTLTCGTVPTNVYVAAYAGATPGQELITQANRVLPKNLQMTSKATVQSVNVGGSIRKVREMSVKSPGYQGVVWSWYDVDGKVATTASLAKFYQLLALVRGRPSGGQIVVIATRIDTDFVEARDRLESTLVKIVLEAGQVQMPVVP